MAANVTDYISKCIFFEHKLMYIIQIAAKFSPGKTYTCIFWELHVYHLNLSFNGPIDYTLASNQAAAGCRLATGH